MNIGKRMRINAFFKNDPNHTVIVPLDHGMTWGPINGINRVENVINILAKKKVDGIIVHKGIITACEQVIVESNIPVIMHLSAGTSLCPKDNKMIIGNVKEAVIYGCSGVSVQLNLGSKNDGNILREVSQIAEQCYKYGMPLLIMAYVQGEGKKVSSIKHVARVAAELGADFVKVLYTEDGGDFGEVVKGCPIPVLVAGGEKIVNENYFIKEMEIAMRKGCKGIAVGRNVFQSTNMEAVLTQLISVVRTNS